MESIKILLAYDMFVLTFLIGNFGLILLILIGTSSKKRHLIKKGIIGLFLLNTGILYPIAIYILRDDYKFIVAFAPHIIFLLLVLIFLGVMAYVLSLNHQAEQKVYGKQP